MRIFMLQRFDLASVSCARRILCQAEELLKRGHEVLLTEYAHPQRRSEVPSVADAHGSQAQIISLPRQIAHFRQNAKRLAALSPPPDIIHVWKAYPDASLLAYWLAHRWRVPLHYDWDDWERGIAHELTGSSAAGWIAGLWDRQFLRFCHTASVASHFLRDQALNAGFPTERLWDAPVGADIERFSPRPKERKLLEEFGLREPVLVYSGQLEVASYAEQAVQAFAHIRAHLPQASLLVLGGGRKLPAVQSLCDQLGLADSTVFTDYVDGNRVPDYLALADCALAPFAENDVTRAKSPLKIAEYLAMGLPVVASDVGEATRMIDQAGRCTPCGDTEAMAQAALEIIQASPAQQNHLRELARMRAVSAYNWRSHVDSLEEAYQAAQAMMR